MLPPGGKAGVEAPDGARLSTGTRSEEEEGVAEEAGGDESSVERGGQGGDHLHNHNLIKAHTSLRMTISFGHHHI